MNSDFPEVRELLSVLLAKVESCKDDVKGWG
jgi:hypothetical protein